MANTKVSLTMTAVTLGGFVLVGGGTDLACLTQAYGSFAYAATPYERADGTASKTITATFGIPSIPAGAQLKQAQIKYEAQYITPNTPPQWTFQMTGASGYTSSTVATVDRDTNNTSPVNPATGAATLPAVDISTLTTAPFGVTITAPLNNVDTRLYAVGLDIFYNQAPTVTSVSASSNTLTPTVSWTYADPEGDLQERYQWTLADGNGMVLYRSPVVYSQATSFAVPSGFLTNYATYKITVVASDIGSNGRWNVNATNTVTFTPQIHPLLMPGLAVTSTSLTATGVANVSPYNGITLAYDPIKGVVTGLTTRSRFNLLDKNDARSSNWTPSYSAGSATVSTTLSVGGAYFILPSSIVYTKTGSTGSITLTSAALSGLTDGVMTVKAHCRCDATTNLTLSLTFNDVNATVVSDTQVNTANQFNELMFSFVVPFGATTVVIAVTAAAVAVNNQFSLDGISITPGALNYTDDSSIEQWLNATTPIYFFPIVSGDGTAVQHLGADTAVWGGTTDAMLTTGTGTSLLYVGSGGHSAVIQGAGRKFLMSCSAFCSRGAVSPNMQMTFNRVGGGATLGSTAVPISLNAWSHPSQTIDMSTDVSGIGYTVQWGVDPANPNQTLELDNLTVEGLWEFTNGNMENGVSAAALPHSMVLGKSYAVGAATGAWQVISWPVGTNTPAASYSNSAPHSGSLCMLLSTVSGAAPYTVGQFVTLNAGQAPTMGFWYKSANAVPLTYGVKYYSTTSILLGQTAVSMTTNTLNTWTQVASSTLTAAPLGTAYAVVFFNPQSPASLTIDDVTCTFSGTVGPTPWIDGGWSEGGFFQAGVSNGASYIALQRSSDKINWSFVREVFPPQTGFSLAPNGPDVEFFASATLVVPNYEWTFKDYEWASVPADGAGSLYYRAAVWFYNAFPPQAPNVGPSSKLVGVTSLAPPILPTEWMLIDPLVPADNIAIPVQTFKVSTPAIFGKFDPVGRSRVVYVNDVVQGDKIDLKLIPVSHATFETIKKQFMKQTTLLLRNPDGYMWYVRVIKRDYDRVWLGSYTKNVLRNLTLSFEQVDSVP